MTTIAQALALVRQAHQRGEVDQALAICEAIVQQMPSEAPGAIEANAQRALLLERLNRAQEAEAVAETVLRHAPQHPAAALARARCLRRRGELEDARTQLQVVPTDHCTPDLLFERGRISDRLGHYGDAMNAFVRANQQLSAGFPSAQRELLPRLIARTQQVCSRVPVDRWTPIPAGDRPAPLFLVGFNRSGTTLLDRMLDAHPDAHILEEVDALDAARETLGTAYPDRLHLLDATAADRARRAYFAVVDRHLPRSTPGLRVDKLPLNTISLPLIYRLFPDARVVFSLRHPCDVVLSNFMQPYAPNAITVHFDSLAASAELYSRVMTLGILLQKQLPLPVLELRYEDLVEDWAHQLRRLLDFAGLPWSPDLLRYRERAGSGTHIKTPSYDQVVEPVYTRARGRWHHYRADLAPVLPTLQPFIERFGYAD